MKSKTPLAPDIVLSRVVRVGTIDGRLLLIVAGLFALLSAAGRDVLGAAVGCLAAGAGALELHGVSLLRQGAARGMAWLVRAQLGLLALMLGYAGLRLALFDPELVRKQLELAPQLREPITQAGLTEDEFIAFTARVHGIIFTVVIGITLLYQGGLARYYHRRRPLVAQALADDRVETPTTL
jgi:hypothetical protein